MNVLSQKDRWELPPLLLNLLESHDFKRNVHAKMYLLETIASAIPPSPPTMAVDVSHRPHKPGNSRLRTQVWVFIFSQHLGGYHMCYMGAVLISLNKGLPSDCSVLAPYSQQQLPAQDPAPSARISQCALWGCLSWAGRLLLHVVSEPPTLYTELCVLCGSPQR